MRLSGCGATPQLRGGRDWSCRRVPPIAPARDRRLGLRGGGAGKCPDPWSLKLGTSPPPTPPCLRPVPSDLHPVCGAELSGTPSQSRGLVWAAVAEPESAGHCRRRPVRRPTRDWPPNFFPGRRPRSRPGRGGGSRGRKGESKSLAAAAREQVRRRQPQGLEPAARTRRDQCARDRRRGLRCGGPPSGVPGLGGTLPRELPVGPVASAGQDREGQAVGVGM